MSYERAFSVPAAAKLVGVASSTLYRWIDAGRVTVYTAPGGSMQVRESTVDRLREELRAYREGNVSPSKTVVDNEDYSP